MKPTATLPLPCIDRIVKIDKGTRVIAEKTVQATEEYFQDHFSGFPVLPGVLMLEGLVQAATWQVRLLEDFKRSQIRMVECTVAKFNHLVRPGNTIELDVELVQQEPPLYDFKGKVSLNGRGVSSARFRLSSQTIVEDQPRFGHLEAALNQKYRQIFEGLTVDTLN